MPTGGVVMTTTTTTATTRSGETESLLGGGDARVRARETRSMGDAKQSENQFMVFTVQHH